jgi:hypothetical protein
MNVSAWAVAGALSLGTVRAVQIFRLSSKVEVVNAVVLTTLANGRGHELSKLLESAGRGLYLGVARSIGLFFMQLLGSEDTDLRGRLRKEAQTALIVASRSLRRFAWLETLSLALIVLAGVGAVTGENPSAMVALGLVAATLLWLSNVYATRNVATRLFAGAMALVDSLLAGIDPIREAHTASAASDPEDA